MANNYIDNKKFYQAILDYQDLRGECEGRGEKAPRIPDFIGECIIKIANNLSRLPKFAFYPIREEMVLDGVENCIRYFNNFDPYKWKNPFGYFTMIIFRTFQRSIKTEKKRVYRKYKAIEELGILDEDELLQDENGNMRQFQVYDNISEYIKTYEESDRKVKEKKKLKAKSKKVGLEVFFE